MAEGVLDASALLAYFNDEAGAEVVERVLVDTCIVSAVNWAEVLTKVTETKRSVDSFSAELARQGILGKLLQIVPFGGNDAAITAELRDKTRPWGLSLADRACLALAISRDLPAFTADRVWGELPLPGLTVQLIR